QSGSSGTSLPSNSDRRFATGASVNSGVAPFGRPRWEARMVFAPWAIRYWIVGIAATIRVSSVIFPVSSCGTLKSTRASTRFPFTSTSSIVFLFITGVLHNIQPRKCTETHGKACLLSEVFPFRVFPCSSVAERLQAFLREEVHQVGDTAGVAPLV